MSKSEVVAKNEVERLDSEYFSKGNLAGLATIRAKPHSRLCDLAFITDGIHASITFIEGSGIKVISAKHPKENTFDLTDFEEISPSEHRLNPRTALQVGDVVISTVGTIGNTAVVTKDMLPANSDRHVGIIRCQAGLQPEFLSTFLLTRYGRLQTMRETTGNVQLNLFISKLRDILVPQFATNFMEQIRDAVIKAQFQLSEAAESFASAESVLLNTLGLGNWQPSEPLTYTRRASEAFAAGRLDSHYFAPRVAELLTRLGKDGRTVRDVAPPRQEKFAAVGKGNFRYIEISDVRNDGTATSETLPISEAPSRATSYVRTGDVLTSTVRPNRRLSALILPEQDGCVASSGFVVLTPQAVPAEVLLTYLRLPLFCELMDLHTSASLYPAISDKDLLALPFPNIPAKAGNTIVAAVRSAHTARQRAQALLAAAQRAVEIAIEDSEPAALAYLEKQSK